MLRSYPTALAVFVSTIIFAQPNITPNNLLMTGEHMTIGVCSDVPVAANLAASAGPMQAWDFSNLTEVAQETLNVEVPSTTWWGYLDPLATTCAVSWVNFHHTYYQVQSGYLTTEAQAFLLPPFFQDTVKVLFTDPEQLMPTSFTYTDTFQDTYAGSTVAFGISSIFAGSVDFEADGYGSLILPTGTYANVIRFHITRQHMDAMGNVEIKDQWVWMSSDHRFILLNMELVTGATNTSAVWFQKTPLTVEVPEHELKTLRVFPNPTAAGAWVELEGVATTSPTSVLVHDGTGRAVQSAKVESNKFQLEELPSGLYFLQLQNNDGDVQKPMTLVVQ